MVALNKAYWPASITVAGREYAIHTEHWFWLDFYRMLGKERPLTDFDFLYEGDAPEDRQTGFEALNAFFAPFMPLPHDIGDPSGPVVDFEQDEDMIFAAFLQCYGIDLKAQPLHWHKFLALFRSLGGTRLNDVMGFRSWDEGDRGGYAEFMRDMKRAWRLEERETAAEKAARDEFEKAFG